MIDQQNVWLTRPFEETEVFLILDTMAADKAPGVDGFLMGVLKQWWSFMKIDFIALLHNFYHSGKLDWRLNTTLIALIPKKLDSSWITDYRPFSLVTSLYKILSKLLAGRLKECASQTRSLLANLTLSRRDRFWMGH